jgi:translation initiation factor IF-2
MPGIKLPDEDPEAIEAASEVIEEIEEADRPLRSKAKPSKPTKKAAAKTKVPSLPPRSAKLEELRSGPRIGAPVVRTPVAERSPIELPPRITVRELAELLDVSPIRVLTELIRSGVMVNVNQQIDYDTAAVVAADLGFETVPQKPPEVELEAEVIATGQKVREYDPEAVPRPPVVTIMGHVDHGKTKLLDAIRKTNVVATEAGGITQKIGAYQVEVHGKKITFLDTPGHEAFTAMRARGAKVADIAVLVVAADDGVMPQTVEAIAHARAAGVPIVVAINKIDKPEANPDRVKQQLADHGLVPHDWGGSTETVPVSARTGQGIEDLLETILLVAEMEDIRANPNKPAVGTVIEARMDPTKGPLATVLIQNGTLNLRDVVVVGKVWGKVRAMYDDKGRKVRKAEPSTPVQILGLVGLPEPGDILKTVADEKTAKMQAEEASRRAVKEEAPPRSLEDIQRLIAAGKVQELPVIVKADLQGSLEAIRGALEKLSSEKVKVNILYQATGSITESDIMLARATGAIIIGFNVRPDPAARRAAEQAKVDIRYYNVIYSLVDDIKAALEGLLEPQWKEVVDGYATVRAVFRLPKNQQVAGVYVNEGKVMRNSLARVLRGGTVIYEGQVASLKRFKEDVREVQAGYECGVGLENFADFQEGDTIEFYHREQVSGRAV